MKTITITTDAGETVTVAADIARHLISVGKAKVAATTIVEQPEQPEQPSADQASTVQASKRRGRGADPDPARA